MNPCHTWRLCCNPLNILIELVISKTRCHIFVGKESLLNRKSTSQKEINNKIHTSCFDRTKTLIDLKLNPKIEQYFGKLWVIFQPDPTDGLKIMIVALKVDNRHNYAKIQIFLFNLFWIVLNKFCLK